jgi:hypothetical protein
MAIMEKTVKMTVTVPGSVLEEAKKMAAAQQRNLSNMVTVLIKKGLDKEKAA